MRSFIGTAPVELAGLAEALGLKVTAARMPNNLLSKIEQDWWGDYEITYNSAHPRTRQRFIIGHEIAHYVLHRDKIGDVIVADGLYRNNQTDWVRARGKRVRCNYTYACAAHMINLCE